MNIMKRSASAVIFTLVLLFSFSACTQAQNTAELKEVKIKTFFHCANGKALLEKELAKEAGVKTVVADIETKIVTVTYEAGKTDQNKLVGAIEKIGYKTEFTADDKPINKACSHDAPATEPATK